MLPRWLIKSNFGQEGQALPNSVCDLKKTFSMMGWFDFVIIKLNKFEND